MIRRPPRSTRTDTLFPYTPLFRSQFQRPILHLGPSFPPPLDLAALLLVQLARLFPQPLRAKAARRRQQVSMVIALVALATRCMDRHVHRHPMPLADFPREAQGDRKSTRLNSSH